MKLINKTASLYQIGAGKPRLCGKSLSIKYLLHMQIGTAKARYSRKRGQNNSTIKPSYVYGYCSQSCLRPSTGRETLDIFSSRKYIKRKETLNIAARIEERYFRQEHDLAI
jgi:hypothetical protein